MLLSILITSLMSYVQVVELGTPYTLTCSMPGGVPLATCALPVGMVIGHGLLTVTLTFLLTYLLGNPKRIVL